VEIAVPDQMFVGVSRHRHLFVCGELSSAVRDRAGLLHPQICRKLRGNTINSVGIANRNVAPSRASAAGGAPHIKWSHLAGARSQRIRMCICLDITAVFSGAPDPEIDQLRVPRLAQTGSARMVTFMSALQLSPSGYSLR
jgi:hypothetical protein